MKKYKWSLLKCLEYLNSRRPELEIRTCFIQQLSLYENRLVATEDGCKTAKWNEVYDKSNDCDNEELLLRNTFVNSQMGPIVEYEQKLIKPSKQVICFMDDTKIATEIFYNETSEQLSPVIAHKKNERCLKPIMKNMKKKISRNYKLENERSYAKKKEITPKLTLGKLSNKQVKIIPSERGHKLFQKQEEETTSPIIKNEDFEPKANDPYKRVVLNSHKDKEQKKLKLNNFVASENKAPTDVPINIFKITNSKLKDDHLPSNITNIIQSPSINNVVILNQPNIHIINNINEDKAKHPKTNENYNKRPSSCRPVEQKEASFQQNILYKEKIPNLQAITHTSNTNLAISKSNCCKILNSYKNGPIK